MKSFAVSILVSVVSKHFSFFNVVQDKVKEEAQTAKEMVDFLV